MMAANRILAEFQRATGLFTINNAVNRNCKSVDIQRCMDDVFEAQRDDQREREVIVRGVGDRSLSSGANIF